MACYKLWKCRIDDDLILCKFYCSFDNIDFLQKEVKIISSIVDIYQKKKKKAIKEEVKKWNSSKELIKGYSS